MNNTTNEHGLRSRCDASFQGSYETYENLSCDKDSGGGSQIVSAQASSVQGAPAVVPAPFADSAETVSLGPHVHALECASEGTN